MSKEIIVATTDFRRAGKDTTVIDSRKQGSWKVFKRLKLEFNITRVAFAPAVTQTQAIPHGLNFTPAFIAMINSNVGGFNALYNAPLRDNSLSCKVFVDREKVYATIVMGYTGSFYFRYKIVILGEKIE
jgi:hypothetical protein